MIDYGDELLYFSRRLEYVDLLQNIDISALSHSTAEQLLEKLGKAGFYLGDYDDDGITLSSYQKLCDSTNNPKWLFYQARVYRYRERKGDHGKAVDILKQVVVQAQQQNHLVLIPQAQLEMGAICVKLNEIPQAIQLIKEGMVFFDIDLQTAENASLENIEHAFDISGISSEHYNSIAWGLRHAGLAYVRQGKANPTIACWYAAKALWEKMEDNLNVAAMHTNLGGAYQLFSISLEKSKYHLQTAQVILEEQQSLYELFRLYNMLTHLYMTKGDFYNALQTSNKILYLTEQGLEVSLGHDLETRGRIYDSIEQWEQAEHFYKESLNYVAPQFRITREIYLADMYLSWGRRLKYNKKHAIDKYYTAKKQFETLLDLAEEKGTSNDDIPRIKLGLAEVLLGIVSLSNNDGDNTVLDDIQTMLEQTQSEFRTISEDRQAEWWFIPARIDRVWAEYHRLQGHFSETESLLENTWDSLLSDMVENGVNKEEIWVLEALVDLERTMKGETHDHNQSAK
ncbi:MAG: hypothetical protein B6242_11580 [Anaerolineaceae bacterium 4572_78]|nr:MAG: hypothetical protein B6242_11580 [Anaerolineaceae bacterium 4572_78]